MKYEKAITKFREIYRPTTREEVLREFEQDDGTLGIYVHNPFCVSICKYCYYKGVKFDYRRDSELYERYYGDYLPGVIEPFLPIISARNVLSYFFGGGTPSLMSADTMREVFRLFPDLANAPSKTIEIHPAIWDEGQLDVLAQFGFSCAIIGVQSFDQAVLARQNRPHVPVEAVRSLAAKLKERGIAVAVDLIYRMDALEAEAIFAQDLQDLLSIDFDVVSLSHSFEDIKSDDHLDEFYGMIERSSILDGYRWEHAESKHLSGCRLPPRQIKKCSKSMRLVAKAIDLDDFHTRLFPFINIMDEASQAWGTPEGEKYIKSILGFGSYKNPRKNTFSHIHRKGKVIEFIEVNNDWRPEYYVVYERHAHEMFSRTTALLGRLDAIGQVPEGIKLHTLNKTRMTRNESIYRRPELEIGVGLSWKDEDPRIQEFIGRIKGHFPNHQEFSNGLYIGE